MKIPKHAISKTVGILVILFTSFGAIAEERKSYDALEFGQIANKFTDVFEGLTLRTVVGFELNRNLCDVASVLVDSSFWDLL